MSEHHEFNDKSDAYCGVSSTAIAYTPDVPGVIDLVIYERNIGTARIVIGFDAGRKRLMYTVQGTIIHNTIYIRESLTENFKCMTLTSLSKNRTSSHPMGAGGP